MNPFSQLTNPETGKHADRDTTLTNPRHQSCDNLGYLTLTGSYTIPRKFLPHCHAALPASTGGCKRSMWGVAVVFAVVLGVAESAPCP
jgi:hypothetical protein